MLFPQDLTTICTSWITQDLILARTNLSRCRLSSDRTEESLEERYMSVKCSHLVLLANMKQHLNHLTYTPLWLNIKQGMGLLYCITVHEMCSLCCKFLQRCWLFCKGIVWIVVLWIQRGCVYKQAWVMPLAYESAKFIV